MTLGLALVLTVDLDRGKKLEGLVMAGPVLREH